MSIFFQFSFCALRLIIICLHVKYICTEGSTVLSSGVRPSFHSWREGERVSVQLIKFLHVTAGLSCDLFLLSFS
jgi:cytochrome c biogenesis factor